MPMGTGSSWGRLAPSMPNYPAYLSELVLESLVQFGLLPFWSKTETETSLSKPQTSSRLDQNQ